MPPVPVFIVLVLVGLVLYAAFGALFALACMRIVAGNEITKDNDFYHLAHRDVHETKGGKRREEEAWNRFAALTILWPLCMAGMAVLAGICIGVAPIVLACLAPWFVAKKMGEYGARTQLEVADAA